MVIKKGDKFKIEHNWKIFLIILVLIVVLIGLLYFGLGNVEGGECNEDSDCVPDSCCHADRCVPLNESPDCDGVMCSMVCSGPLDCGAGHCSCVNGECKVISDK